MIPETSPGATVAIACGGTGGHVFPGLAVARVLQRTGMTPLLVISEKEVDREAIRGLTDIEVLTVPAVGLSLRQLPRFVAGLLQSRRICRDRFRRAGVRAVLGMGGFTSAAPLWAGRGLGAATFLHESNSIPGRANRLAARWADEVFVGFRSAAGRIAHRRVTHTGTPVRSRFVPRDAGECRKELGLDPGRPVLLVAGGSQGAEALNQVVMESLAGFRRELPDLQFVQLTGRAGFERVKEAHAAAGTRAFVRPFFDAMETAMGAATLALSRAGASSLAEMAAMRLPSILIPYPSAADDHQWFNAKAFVDEGAACCRAQSGLTADWLVSAVAGLMRDEGQLGRMRRALARCDHPEAAVRIAEAICAGVARTTGKPSRSAESQAPETPVLPGRPAEEMSGREGRRTRTLETA